MLIHLLDLKAKEEVGVLEIPLPGEDPYLHDFNMAVSPDWRYLAAAVMLMLDGRPGQCLVYLRDLETRQEIAVFEGDPGNHVELAFSPDGRILASKVRSEGDWIVRMWDVDTKEEIEFWDPSEFLWLGPDVAGTQFPQGWESIGSSLDGRIRVLEGTEALSLWDVERKEIMAVLEEAQGPVAFSMDGGLLASVSRSGIILVWDVSPWTGMTPAAVESVGKKALVWGELKSIDGEDIVEQAKLFQNYPNPFNPETWIPFQMAHESEVILRIYDAKGSLVREMSLGRKPAGSYTQRAKAIHWDGRNDSGERVASGVYFYTLRVGDYTETRKMILAE